MRALITSIMLLVCMTEYGYATADETLAHVKMLQKEIALYQQRAARDEREAEDLLFKNYPLYRQYLKNQAANERIAEQLKEKLHALQQRNLK